MGSQAVSPLRKRKPRSKWVDRAQYAALRWVSSALNCLPPEVAFAGANLVGDLFYVFDKKHRDRAQGNLRRSFPDMPEREVRRVARGSMRSLMALGVEVMFTPRLVRLNSFRRIVDMGDFRQALDLMLGRHRGLIMLTGHYGNWEVLGYVLAVLGFRTVSIARPLDNPHVNDYVLGVRERQGQLIIDKKGATDTIQRELERGGMVGIIADQNAGPKGMFVDFFGRKASAYKSIGLLAMNFDVPIVVGYARRKPGRYAFTMGTQDVILPEEWKREADPLRYITQRYTSAIEAFVREDPTQYLWVHRRWKTRPKGEAPERYD